MDWDDTPVWKIHKNEEGIYEPVLSAWYTEYRESDFLTNKTFGTKTESEVWLQEFWQAYWRLAL